MRHWDWSPLGISLKTSLCATVIAFFLGIFAAWFVTGLRGKRKAVIDSILTLPLVLPPTVLGFFLLVIFGWNSPLGRCLRMIGVRIIFSWEATVIAAAVVAFPLIYRTVLAAFEQIDTSILDAARTLGLTEWTIFRRIMLPMAWPGCAAGMILGFARALGEFGATLMIAGNIPHKTQTIPIAIWSAVEGNNMQTAMIWVLLIVGISSLVILPLNLIPRKE
ncbi:MAG: molybdate ABC transporter permease subunit [Planctomycetaceae bacterium]|jgi:molybdate transport system permease protein|nr:molybdate ABC transporter permease subunit [Planctomycetaceae bacterium]